MKKINTNEPDITMNENIISMNNNYRMDNTDNNNNHIEKILRNKNRRKKEKRFNSPFCKLSNDDIGKYLLDLIDKHFKKDNPLSKILNRNIKINYSCTKNIS